MKKALSIVLVLTFLLGLIGCSSKEKIPTISEVSQMKYSEVKEALTGKDIKAITLTHNLTHFLTHNRI